MGTIPASDNVFETLRMSEAAAPATPPSAQTVIYTKADGRIYWKDDAGTEYSVASLADLSGISALDDIPDVNAPTPADGDVLTWDSTPGEWVAAAPTGGGGGAPTTVPYVTTAADGTLSAEVVIPDLAQDPRIPPGGSADMEFDSGTTIGGTALGTPTTIDANTTHPGGLYVKKTAASGYALHGRYWTLSGLSLSLPVTMTVHIRAMTMPNADFMRVGAGFAVASPGACDGMYLEHNGSRYLSIVGSTTPSSGAGYVTQGNELRHQVDNMPLWLRIVMASSTDVTNYWSTDGKIWTRFGSANRNPGFTIGSVFVAVDPEQTGQDIEAVFGSIRFS